MDGFFYSAFWRDFIKKMALLGRVLHEKAKSLTGELLKNTFDQAGDAKGGLEVAPGPFHRKSSRETAFDGIFSK